MPYIKKERRDDSAELENVGDLTYVMAMICKEYMERKGESYQTHAEIRGALENTASEWYRRKTAPYEDRKKEENGDIF